MKFTTIDCKFPIIGHYLDHGCGCGGHSKFKLGFVAILNCNEDVELVMFDKKKLEHYLLVVESHKDCSLGCRGLVEIYSFENQTSAKQKAIELENEQLYFTCYDLLDSEVVFNS